jgi:hypothetical protein
MAPPHVGRVEMHRLTEKQVAVLHELQSIAMVAKQLSSELDRLVEATSPEGALHKNQQLVRDRTRGRTRGTGIFLALHLTEHVSFIASSWFTSRAPLSLHAAGSLPEHLSLSMRLVRFPASLFVQLFAPVIPLFAQRVRPQLVSAQLVRF